MKTFFLYFKVIILVDEELMNMHAMDEVKPLDDIKPIDTQGPFDKKDEKNPNRLGRIFNIAGLCSAAASLLTLPVLFAPAAIILGTAGLLKGDEKISTYVVLAAVCSALIGAMTMLYLPHNGIFTPTAAVVFNLD